MNMGPYSIKSLTPEHAASVRSLAALPEFTGEFTTLSAGKDSCKWLTHPASVVACDAAGTLIGFLLCDLQPMEEKEWQVLVRGVFLTKAQT